VGGCAWVQSSVVLIRLVSAAPRIPGRPPGRAEVSRRRPGAQPGFQLGPECRRPGMITTPQTPKQTHDRRFHPRRRPGRRCHGGRTELLTRSTLPPSIGECRCRDSGARQDPSDPPRAGRSAGTPAAPARPPLAAARGAGRSARARPAAAPRSGAPRAGRAATHADASACRPGNRSPRPDTSRGERRRRKARRPVTVRPSRRQEESGRGTGRGESGEPGNPRAGMCGWRASAWRPANCGSLAVRVAPTGRFQIVPQRSLFSVRIGPS